MRYFLVLVLCMLPAVYVSAAIDTIIPLPKSIHTAGDPIPIEEFSIVADRSEKARIGAAEINERIRSLGGVALPVLDLDGSLPSGKLIVIGTCTVNALAAKAADLEVTPESPGRQGYVIEYEDGKVWLVGSDALGTLYAAVTCRQLIVKRNGVLMLQPATVRDWPDFAFRQNGTSFDDGWQRNGWYGAVSAEIRGDLDTARSEANKWVVAQKICADFMLRAKINMSWSGTNIRPNDPPERLEICRAALRKANEYSFARGIEPVASDSTYIGKSPADDDKPEFKNVVYHRAHKRYFCWSLLDIHRQQAEIAAKWLADCGYKGFFLHATDGGNWRNPAMWKDRCQRCREMYGDDHSKADATVFKIYYDTIKKRIPDLKFIAVVYPYSPSHLKREYILSDLADTTDDDETAGEIATQAIAGQNALIKRLNVLLPEDIFVCIREGKREDIDIMRKLWGERRFQLYYEYSYWKGWRPYFSTAALATKSFHYTSHDDILYGDTSPHGWCEMTQLLGVECAWNVNRPGGREFISKAHWRGLNLLTPPSPERKTFAERGSRFLFGEEAGPLMAPVFAENISRSFILSPELALRYVHVETPAEIMRGQVAATTRALASLDKLWDLQAETPVLDDFGYGYFLNTYQLTAAARVLAGHKGYLFAAQDALNRRDAEALDDELKAAYAWLDTAGAEWLAINSRIPKRKLLFHYTKSQWSYASQLVNIKIDELREEVDLFAAKSVALIGVPELPRWFKTAVAKRMPLEAVPAEGDIIVDGRLDEPAWRKAPLIDYFVDYRELRLGSLETRARLLYTPTTLYVGFECHDPAPSDIAAVFPGRDQYALCDSVEVLAALADEGIERGQWMVDSKETLLDARAVKADDGSVAHTQKWNSRAKVAVWRGEDRWTVELAIPGEELNMSLQRGQERSLLLCRNIVHTRTEGEEEVVAVRFTNGEGFHKVDKYAYLKLLGTNDVPTPPWVDLGLLNPHLTFETTSDGTGTRVSGKLAIQSSIALHHVKLTAEFSNGAKALAVREIGTAKTLRVTWSPKRPFSEQIPGQHPDMTVTFRLTAEEGTWTFVHRVGTTK